MVNRFEAFGIFISVSLMALALFLINMNTTADELDALSGSDEVATAFLSDNNPAQTLYNSIDGAGNITQLLIDDVIVGSGAEVIEGDTVAVHYIGTLQSGQQFDNSYLKGEVFEFTVGEGRVIAGWEQGIIGMKPGGQRILVIPAELAYGDQEVGPIPSNSPLVFAIELLEIKPQ